MRQADVGELNRKVPFNAGAEEVGVVLVQDVFLVLLRHGEPVTIPNVCNVNLFGFVTLMEVEEGALQRFGYITQQLIKPSDWVMVDLGRPGLLDIAEEILMLGPVGFKVEALSVGEGAAR
ncbi:hypothetical protein E2562_024477 [Oryza meyeriana var. granulata]|uniref:Uncharacterized protein n=1 Tax=Oryza meyeriana var. granulata TaxID=110450 RepID=A0A6G1FBJ5_9ORYZ|nr:hypothetical protein E2562_024477 [Oryza meyeriana var. granulata]